MGKTASTAAASCISKETVKSSKPTKLPVQPPQKMAEKVNESTTPIECGFCLRQFDAMEEPRVLPCEHVHCTGCLRSFFQVNRIVQCPKQDCKQTYAVAIDSLPTTDARGRVTMYCNACEKKGLNNSPAQIYCTTCAKKLCDSHMQSHDELLDGHITMDIERYRAEAAKLELRMCPTHTTQPYTAGCGVCFSLFCAECLLVPGLCTNEKAHQLASLTKLVAVLREEIDKLKAEMIAKEDELEKLFKEMSNNIAEFDKDTKSMLANLHKTRDEQLQAIRLKYEQMEVELIEKRRKTRIALVDFHEADVAVQWNDIRNQRLRVDSIVEHSHQCDLVTGFVKTRNELRLLINNIIPSLEQEMITLESAGEKRDPELTISIAVPPTDPPMLVSLEFLHVVQAGSPVTSACSYNGQMFAGLDTAVIRADNHFHPHLRLYNYSQALQSIFMHKEKIYALVNDDPPTINVHDINGVFVTKWEHVDDISFNKLTIASDQVIVPDRQNKRLVVYSLEGDVLKHISIPQLSKSGVVCLCTVSNDSVAVSDCHGGSQVFRVNIRTDEVMWTTPMSRPQGIVCYGGKYLLVAQRDSTTVKMLNARTGEEVSELSAPGIQGEMLDLDICEDQLVAPSYTERVIRFYRLKF